MGKRLLREGYKIIAEAGTLHRLAGGQQIDSGGFTGLLIARTAW